MTSRPVLAPGPNHPIKIERNPNRVQVRSANTVIADTTDALTLREANYPPVQYIPRADIDMAQLKRSAHATYCPYKGDAAYFDIVALGDKGAKAVWTYEQPYPAVAEIAGHLAFYPNIVSVTELTDAVSE
jgi:uncharacterized protein (DUF427 family)